MSWCRLRAGNAPGSLAPPACLLLAELRQRTQLELARALVDSSSIRALPQEKTEPNPTHRP